MFPVYPGIPGFGWQEYNLMRFSAFAAHLPYSALCFWRRFSAQHGCKTDYILPGVTPRGLSEARRFSYSAVSLFCSLHRKLTAVIYWKVSVDQMLQIWRNRPGLLLSEATAVYFWAKNSYMIMNCTVYWTLCNNQWFYNKKPILSLNLVNVLIDMQT